MALSGARVVPTGFPGRGVISPSLAEQDTGLSWVDGSRIYETTVFISALPPNTTWLYPHNIADVAQFIEVRGIADNGMLFLPLPFPQQPGPSDQIDIRARLSSIEISTSRTDRAAFQAYITLRYTKAA